MTDDLQWRRPAGDAPGEPTPPAEPPAGPPPYAGPPRSTPPPHGWRPRMLIQPPPPRALPGQDLDEIDSREHEARVVTYGVGMIAGAVLLIVLFVLCGRVVF